MYNIQSQRKQKLILLIIACLISSILLTGQWNSSHSTASQYAKLKILAIKKREEVMNITCIGVDLAKRVFQIRARTN